MSNSGWIKLYRCTFKNPIVMKDADHLAVWMWLLGKASWNGGYEVLFGGERYTLKKGELTTGRKVIADELKISESKVQRILKLFESEHQIEQRTDRQCRLISIVNWDLYQSDEQRFEQPLNNVRTTSEQRVNTNKEGKEKEEGKESNIYSPAISEIVDYLNEITGSSYKASTKKTRSCIQARLNEGFTVDDFKVVIWKKTKEWKGTDYEKFLRPETLFGNKFEGYLNQKETTTDRLGWLDNVRL